MQIIIKQDYAHYNRSLGMQIKSKDHYDRICKERGFVSDERAAEMAIEGRKGKIKDYKLTKESEEIIKYAHGIKDSKGNVKLGDRAIETLIKNKAIGKKIPEYMQLPEAYKPKGGFSK